MRSLQGSFKYAWVMDKLKSEHLGKVENIMILVSRYLARLLGLLLELLNGPLVDSTALVDQVTGGGGLACEIDLGFWLLFHWGKCIFGYR